MINSDIYLHAGENCNSEIDDCRVAAERQFRDSSDSRMFARCNKQRDYCTMASDSRWFVLVYRYRSSALVSVPDATASKITGTASGCQSLCCHWLFEFRVNQCTRWTAAEFTVAELSVASCVTSLIMMHILNAADKQLTWHQKWNLHLGVHVVQFMESVQWWRRIASIRFVSHHRTLRVRPVFPMTSR